MDSISDEIEERYLCPICMDVLEEPYTIEKCGHSLCAGCIESLINSVSVRQKYEKKKIIPLKCPMCQGEFTKKQTSSNYELESELGVRKARCECGKEIKLNEYRRHQERCKKYKEVQKKSEAESMMKAKGVPQKKSVNRSTFNCPLCSAEHLDRVGFLEHVNTKHRKGEEAVCPICACQTWGDPNQTTPSLRDHVNKRHQFDLEEHGDFEEDEEEALQRVLLESMLMK